MKRICKMHELSRRLDETHVQMVAGERCVSVHQVSPLDVLMGFHIALLCAATLDRKIKPVSITSRIRPAELFRLED